MATMCRNKQADIRFSLTHTHTGVCVMRVMRTQANVFVRGYTKIKATKKKEATGSESEDRWHSSTVVNWFLSLSLSLSLSLAQH